MERSEIRGGESLDIYVFAGAGLIISGMLWNLRAETVRRASVAARAV